MTARAVFKKADVQRAIEGVLATGLTISEVEFTSEGFFVRIGEAQPAKRRNPLDRLHGREVKLVDKLYGFKDG